ncbi:MAG: hypothetical protein BMS9Abin20_0903 [Acidimicrobiia bacterium]|nr:MAG: hypothetical protein BMS9Abin20_0903 [Acidimicrobiia bacterium]
MQLVAGVDPLTDEPDGRRSKTEGTVSGRIGDATSTLDMHGSKEYLYFHADRDGPTV